MDTLVRPVNPIVMAVLRSRFHAIASAALLVVSWSGRSSGRRFSIPTGYQRDGDDVIVMLSKADRKRWWKNFRSPWPADLLIAGRERTAMGTVVPPGSDAFYTLVEGTIRATPFMAKQFGLEAYDASRGLSDADRAILREKAAAIRFELTD
ncbi:hypothetical protein K2X89_04540 [Myxococcota bacterium]|nr:hypothetical protein [Myxococcota bacterium]